MASNSSQNSTDSDVFYVEQSSNDQSIPRPNTPIVLNSTEISGDDTREMISISSIASPEPHIVTIDNNSNDPTMPYGVGPQLPIVPPSLNDLNLPPNPFNILSTMAIANNNDNDYSPESPEPSLPSPIPTPPMNISHFNSWEKSYTTTDDVTFHSSDEPRRIYFLPPSPSTPPSPPRRQKEDWAWECPFQKRGSVAARLRSLGSDDPLSKGHHRSIKQRLKTVKTLRLTHELQYYLAKHLMHHLLNILQLGYVVDTYPPLTHTCNFCRRNVVVAYRPIIFISCKSTYPIRVILVNWSLLGRNRCGTTEYSLYFILILGAIYIINFDNFYVNPPF